MLAFVGLHWPSLAFLAFVALDDFLKQKLAFVDKIQAQMTCFQQSDVKTNYQTRSGILKHCGQGESERKVRNSYFLSARFPYKNSLDLRSRTTPKAWWV